MPQNKYLQIAVAGDHLTALESWTGQLRTLMPEKALTFFSTEVNGATCTFERDNKGMINSLVVFGTDRWIRTSDTSSTVADLSMFAGKYKLQTQTEAILQITVQGNALNATHCGMARFFSPIVSSHWNLWAICPDMLDFAKGDDGKIVLLAWERMFGKRRNNLYPNLFITVASRSMMRLLLLRWS